MTTEPHGETRPVDACEERHLTDSEDDAWLASLGPLLLRDEYPDQMAERSCSCEPDAICGAHRLLARYGALYAELRRVNADRRRLRAEIRETNRPTFEQQLKENLMTAITAPEGVILKEVPVETLDRVTRAQMGAATRALSMVVDGKWSIVVPRPGTEHCDCNRSHHPDVDCQP